MTCVKKSSFSFRLLPLVICLFVSACGTQYYQGSGPTQMNSRDVIKPCAQQFHPQTSLKHVATQVQGQHLYFLSGVHLYALNAENGPRLFAIDAQSGKLMWHTDTLIDSMSQLLVADGLLYTSQNKSLVGLNPQNGQVVWRYNGIQQTTLLANGHVLYATSDSGDLYAFETQTHTLLWHEKLRTLGAGEATRLKLMGDVLYVGFNDLGQNQFGTIHAINTQTGSEYWSTKVNWNVSTLDLA